MSSLNELTNQTPTPRDHVVRMLDSAPYTGFLTIIILFSVFAWDAAAGWLPMAADPVIETLMTVTMAIFVIELFLMIYAVGSWWKS